MTYVNSKTKKTSGTKKKDSAEKKPHQSFLSWHLTQITHFKEY